jgi:hypothetical protein
MVDASRPVDLPLSPAPAALPEQAVANATAK